MVLLEAAERFGEVGISDFAFASRAPADEYSAADLRADFPEGEYRFSGIDREGAARVGTALLRHDLPGAPVIRAPELADEGSPGKVTLPRTGLVVRWNPVTETLDGGPLTLAGYQVAVTQVQDDARRDGSRPEYDVRVPPGTTELAVADGVLRPGTVYRLEVLALEEGGNRTVSVGFFTTES